MSLFQSTNQADECGHCMGCRWWQHENEDAEAAIGLCMHQELTHFSIQVTAHSGCNRYEAAKVEAVTGGV